MHVFTRVCKHGGISACVYQLVCLYVCLHVCLRMDVCVHVVSPCLHTCVHLCNYTSMYILIFACLHVCPWYAHVPPCARMCVCVPPECPPLYEHIRRCPCTHAGSACCAHPYDPLNLPNFSFLPLCPTEEESTEQTSQVRACLAAHLSSGPPGWGSPGALGLSKVAMGQEGGRPLYM